MKKRFLSILLAAIMVLAIVPLSAITTSAADDTVIDTITITDVIEPVTGQIPANTTYTLAQSDKVDVDLSTVGYQQDTAFEAGKVYSFVIFLTPKTGYSFSNSVHATINGMEAKATKLGDNLLVQLNYICASGTKTAVNSIDLSWFVPPVYGETPSVTPLKVPDGAGYWTSNVSWKKGSTSFSGTFDYGTYKAEIPVYTNDGFEFVGAPTATVNGMSARVIPQTAEFVIVSLECTVTPEKINEVDLSWFVPPVAGETPSVIPLKTPDDGGYTSGSVYWYKDGTPFDGTFGYDTYTVKIPVVAKEGYEFLYNATAKINNMPATVEVDDATHIWVSMEYTVGTEKINEVDLIWFVPPVAGETPSVTPLKTPDDGGYISGNVYWYKGDTAFDSTFGYDTYIAKIPVVATEGYEFLYNATATINNMPATVEWEDATHIIVSIECTVKTNKIDFVDLYWFVPPVAGQTPSVTPLKTPDDSGYLSSSVYWYKDGVDFDGTFTPGSTYRVTIPVYAQEGYEFLWNATATINNVPATVEIQDSTHILVTIECTLNNEIDIIAIFGFNEPFAGATADYLPLSLPTGTNYWSSNLRWYKNGDAFEGEFVIGETYTVEIPLVASDGFSFLADVTATVNGKDATVTIIDATHATLTLEYTVESHKITMVNVTGIVDPVAGKTPVTVLPTVSFGCVVSKIEWYKGDALFNGTFEAGHKYTVKITVTNAETTEFEASVSAAVNGKPATIEWDGDNYVITMEYVALAASESTPDGDDTNNGNSGTTPGTDDPNTPDNPNNTPDDPTDDDKDGLGAGAIIGIVVGVLAVLGGGGFALYWFVLKKKPTDPTDPTTPVEEEAPESNVDEEAAVDANADEDAPEAEDKKDDDTQE